MFQLCLQLFVCTRRGHVEWPENNGNPLCTRCGKWLPTPSKLRR
jgi:hypothetical protein